MRIFGETVTLLHPAVSLMIDEYFLKAIPFPMYHVFNKSYAVIAEV